MANQRRRCHMAVTNSVIGICTESDESSATLCCSSSCVLKVSSPLLREASYTKSGQNQILNRSSFANCHAAAIEALEHWPRSLCSYSRY